MASEPKIRRIPTGLDVAPPVSLRPSGANPGIDVSSQFEGAQALARGAQVLAAGLGKMGDDIANKERVADVAAADTAWLKGKLEIGNKYESDGNYQTFDKRVTVDSVTARDQAAALIRDPETRQAWLDKTELDRLGLVDAVNDRGRALSQDADRSTLSESIADMAEIYSDPTTPQIVRDQIKKQVNAQVDYALGSGLLTPSQADTLRRNGLEVSEENLAINRANYEIKFGDPQKVSLGMGIVPADGGSSVAAAVASVNGGSLPPLELSLAKTTAELMGDVNFPTDPKLAKAYLSDPERAAEYAKAATAMLNDRYGGDIQAVAIALDPEGGTVLADQFAKAHDESVLPAGVRDRYRLAMQNLKAGASGKSLPIIAGEGVDLIHTDPAVLDRWEKLQGMFGSQVPLISAHRSEEHNKAVGGADKSMHIEGRALDVDVSRLSEEQRVNLIELASSMGFTGIGVYKNSLHLDTGDLRAWGPDYHSGSVPAWAKDAIDAHVAGTVKPAMPGSTMVDPVYAAIPYDKRLTLKAAADAAQTERNTLLQASLATVVENAPAAIANTGTYTGAPLPGPESFVKAFGATVGIPKYQEFMAQIETSRMIYGFKTQSGEEIMAQVTAAAPKSSGNDAALETQRFNTIAAAAEQIRTARAADPAGYVIDAMPKVAEAWKAAQEDPSKLAEALTLTQNAQAQLGMSIELLPKAMAAGAVQTFNDATLPVGDRVKAVAGLLLSTKDEAQQKLIFNQLLKEKLPPYTQGAVAAMMRNDIGAAQNLMRAVMIDPEKISGDLGSVTKTQIDAAIQDGIFDEGQIGDVIYGVTGASVDNLERMKADSTLIDRDVRLHLLDGTAGGDVNKAVELTIKDMFGDVQVVYSGGVKVTIPAGEDPHPLQLGFRGLQSSVADAMREDMRNGMVQILGEDVAIRSTGMSGVVELGIDNAVAQVLSEGYFINAGGTNYQFFNPFTSTVVGKADGTPLLFTKAQVLAAGQNVPDDQYYEPGRFAGSTNPYTRRGEFANSQNPYPR